METDIDTTEHRLGDISVRYYGPALDVDHSLSARVLAPALLDLSDAIEAAKSEVSPDAEIELRIEATKAASFDVNMFLQAVDQFANSPQGNGLQYLVDVGGIGFLAAVVGAFKAVVSRFKHGKETIEKTKSAPPDSSTFTDELVTVKYPDGTTAEYHGTSLRISHSMKFVNSAGKALAGPSNQDGIDGAQIAGAGETVDVDADTAQAMAHWIPDENVVSESDAELTVQPLDAHFESGKKWHVTTGGETRYSVDIDDEAFIKSVENGRRIGKKDLFIVTMHTVSSIGRDGKLKASHTITKVKKHIPVDEGNQGLLF